MKEKDFNRLSKEMKVAYLERGGIVEPDIPIKVIHYRRLEKKQEKKSNKFKSHKRIRQDVVKRLARELNENLPRSEKWFQKLWAEHKHHNDVYNYAYKGIYIPDVINKQYKYIIEIDGSIHDKHQQKKKDLKRDQYFEKEGYITFRITAYDRIQFDKLVKAIVEYRNKQDYIRRSSDGKHHKRELKRFVDQCIRCKNKALDQDI